MRFLEEPLSERLRHGRLVVAKHSWKKPGDPFDDRQRDSLSPCEYEVTDRYFLVDQVLGDALVHTLVSAADEHQMVQCCPSIEHRLVEWSTCGRHEDSVCTLERDEGILERTDHQDHAGTTAERSVVDLPVWASTVGPEVERFHPKTPFVDGSSNDAHRQRGVEKLGKQGDDRDLQGKPP